jgi:hypothetical protein
MTEELADGQAKKRRGVEAPPNTPDRSQLIRSVPLYTSSSPYVPTTTRTVQLEAASLGHPGVLLHVGDGIVETAKEGTKFDVPFTSESTRVLIGGRLVPYQQLPVVQTTQLLITEVGRLRAEVEHLKSTKAEKRQRSSSTPRVKKNE